MEGATGTHLQHPPRELELPLLYSTTAFASLEVIVKCHRVWLLMTDSKTPVPSQREQVSGSRARNNNQCSCRYALLERPAVLKHEAPRATANAAHHSLQTDEAGRAVIAVHH